MRLKTDDSFQHQWSNQAQYKTHKREAESLAQWQHNGIKEYRLTTVHRLRPQQHIGYIVSTSLIGASCISDSQQIGGESGPVFDEELEAGPTVAVL